MTAKDEARDFLMSRRANLTPRQAGLPAGGGDRRVPGLRREEVAVLAGVSTDYYTRLERGDIGAASRSVLEIPGEAGLSITTYTAEEGSPAADKLSLLATWAATREADVSNTTDAAVHAEVEP